MIYGNKANVILNNYNEDFIGIFESDLKNTLLSENFVTDGFKTLGAMLKKLVTKFFDMIEKLWSRFMDRLTKLCKNTPTKRNLNEANETYSDRGKITYIDPNKKYVIIEGNYMKEALDLKFNISIDIFEDYFMKLYFGFSSTINKLKDRSLSTEERNEIFRKFHSNKSDEFGINDLLYPGRLHYDYDMINHFRNTFVSGSSVFLNAVNNTTNIDELMSAAKQYITFLPMDEFKLFSTDFERNYSMNDIKKHMEVISRNLRNARRVGMKCVDSMDKTIHRMEMDMGGSVSSDSKDEFTKEYKNAVQELGNNYCNIILSYYRNYLAKYAEFCGNLLTTTSTLLGLAITQHHKCSRAFMRFGM